ncbi:MAG TPA: ATP-binding cassette domain-containing protein, partial [Rhodopila sp.]|nr:ATP-binding cassette domain-containing protein [Rhodopila sp.]
MRYGSAPRLRRDLIALVIVSVAYVAVSMLVTNSYYQLIMTLVPIWAVFGVSWNILSGYGGQLSFGHAAFFGIGAYVVTLALVYWNLTPWLGIPLGMIVAGIAAVLIGIPTFRLRGHYFALSMLAYPLAILYFLQYLGFQEVPLPMHRDNPAAFLEFTNPHLYTLVAVGLLIAALFVCMLVENSRFGLALLAVRQNELAAEAAGINSRLWKMRALVASGMMAAAAGGLYACVLLVVTPDSVFGMLVSAQAVVVTLFGGVASVWGPVIGAAILVPLAESLNAELGNILPGIQGVVYGVAIIAITLAAPDGLFWTVRDRLFKRPAVPAALPTVPPRIAARRDAQSGPLLKVENLSRSFGGLRAVSDVTFQVAAGEILGIIGPNGAGKTSLFNLLNGVLSSDQGVATVGGVSMTGRKVHQVCRMGVGRTFQVVRSFPRLPLLDNVIVGAYGAGLSDHDAIAAAADALERVGLSAQAGVAAGQLTNKQLRLMEQARALAASPRLLLLAET